MAEFSWTPAQEDAIESEGCNILVSAAAGSGKTAVLVERVMRKLKRAHDPADISSLLIMTFTRAAAAQMKDKLYKGIRKALKEDPDNEHLKKQLFEIHNARIYTIDALCMDIVKENFQLVDIDPGFRIADESEAAILKEDVMKEMIEEQYVDPSDEFLQFVNFYIDKSDSNLEKIIFSMYGFAQSHPEPEKWIRNCMVPYSSASERAVNNTEEENRWLSYLGQSLEKQLCSIRDMAEQGIKISELNYGPYKYADRFREIIDFINGITGDDKIFDLRREGITEFLGNWQAAPRITAKDEVDDNLKSAAKSILDDIKKKLEQIRANFFEKELNDVFSDMSICADVAGVIGKLTIEFGRKYKAAKKDKNIADFNDIAHYALQILIKHDEDGSIIRDENGVPVYTQTADLMSAEIREIIVDEYQDTNMLQEYIICALSSERFGRANVFMVGDVKQSIYGFRMACPELFNEKYNSYAEGGTAAKRILLNSNFRSREEVLDITNYVFDQVMTAEVGGIEYTDGHELVKGADYPSPENDEQFMPELVFINGSGDTAKQSEAYIIAKKIENLIENGKVSDQKNNCLRKVRYSDIAILARGTDNVEIEKMLEARQIPVIKVSNKGFFDTFEIKLAINLLKIIDNPYQDIPFTAVITSPVVGVSANDLAKIRISYSRQPFSMFEACRQYAQNDKKSALGIFLEKLDIYRLKSSSMDINSFLNFVMEDSALMDMIIAMPAGDSRRANIEMLKNKAQSYSKSSYQGLFNFLRYIKQMKDAEIDFGQAQLLDEEMDAVTMMTIHKSKGLEFPVVILARAGKEYNTTDLSKNIVLDRELGMGIEYRNPVKRTITKTLIMETIREAKRQELYAEELRLLYVAMTRAKEKLIITGSARGLEKQCETWCRGLYETDVRLGRDVILRGNSFLKNLGGTLVRHESGEGIRAAAGFDNVRNSALPYCRFDMQISDVLDAEELRAVEIFDTEIFAKSINDAVNNAVINAAGNAQTPASDAEQASSGDLSEIAKQLDSVYPYEAATTMTIKISASSLEKHPADEEAAEDFGSKKIFSYHDDETGLRGSERGNAYHKFFELLKYEDLVYDAPLDLPEHQEGTADSQNMQKEQQPAGSIDDSCCRCDDSYCRCVNAKEALSEMLEKFKEESMISEEYAGAIDIADIETFLNSDIGIRMKKAADAGTLVREQQFVMQRLLDGEECLIQGIIDAFFEEDGEMVLVDYKTDRGKSESELAQIYIGQQMAYRDAIEKALGKKVKDAFLYSVSLGKSVRLPIDRP